ncbi:MAG: hypothetical protein ACM31L_02700, partial [Actinomycetota bacterium]
MIRFRPGEWSAQVEAWLAPAFVQCGQLSEARDVSRLAIAEDETGPVGAVLVSFFDGWVFIEAVGGEPAAGLARSAMEWAKDLAREVKAKGVAARTAKPAMVLHLVRAGARLDAAYLSMEV